MSSYTYIYFTQTHSLRDCHLSISFKKNIIKQNNLKNHMNFDWLIFDYRYDSFDKLAMTHVFVDC